MDTMLIVSLVLLGILALIAFIWVVISVIHQEEKIDEINYKMTKHKIEYNANLLANKMKEVHNNVIFDRAWRERYMNIVQKLWEKAKEAETPEEGNAYLIALLYVEEYLQEKKENK